MSDRSLIPGKAYVLYDPKDRPGMQIMLLRGGRDPLSGYDVIITWECVLVSDETLPQQHLDYWPDRPLFPITDEQFAQITLLAHMLPVVAWERRTLKLVGVTLPETEGET